MIKQYTNQIVNYKVRYDNRNLSLTEGLKFPHQEFHFPEILVEPCERTRIRALLAKAFEE